MRQTKKITLCALLVALGSAIMILGAVIEVLDLVVCVFASLLVVFVYLEIGSPYTYLVWICTSLATALLYSGTVIWVEYLLVFGIYPMLKAFIERLPRPLWLILKIAFINAIVASLFFIVEGLFGVPFFEEELLIMKVVTWVLINVAFIVYDRFITVMVRVYMERIRPKISKLLK
ncbi:MAG: hypothetical protein IJW03_04745 [Clostridia bacterium]|nr:hypothetical protein [Clostridia bacterium]